MGQETGLETGSQVEKKSSRNNLNILTSKYPKQGKVLGGARWCQMVVLHLGQCYPPGDILEVLKIFLIITVEGGLFLHLASGSQRCC